MYSPPIHSPEEIESISESVDQLIDLETESKREEYWTKTVQEVSESVNSKPHYKHFVKGEISVFGNACTIKEVEGDISPEQAMKRSFEKIGRRKKPPERRKGDIKGFTQKSRHRMMKKMNRVDFKNDRIAYFFTLTYPDPFPINGEVYKADLDVFLKRMKRQFGELSYMWKLEVQFKRGAPHYHLIVFFEKRYNIDFVKKWMSKNWFEVVQRNWETKNYDHLKVGTNTKIVRTLRQLTNYVTKYITKKEQDDKLTDQGRYWGCSRNWGDTLVEHLSLSGKQLIIFRRLMKRYIRKSNRRMARKITHYPNIEVWANWKLILDALNWSCTMY